MGKGVLKLAFFCYIICGRPQRLDPDDLKDAYVLKYCNDKTVVHKDVKKLVLLGFLSSS